MQHYNEINTMAVGQNQWYHFVVGAPPILVYFSGDWDVHWGYDLDFDPWPYYVDKASAKYKQACLKLHKCRQQFQRDRTTHPEVETHQMSRQKLGLVGLGCC